MKGAIGGQGDVYVFPVLGGPGQRPPELQGIVLLPVDVTGRTPFTQFLDGQPRLKSDLPGASRVILPHDMGALYRYRRSHAGGTDFGYFLVRPSGLASFLAAFPGTGPNGNGDPIPYPVALSDAADALLVATRPEAGGDLFEIDLATAQSVLLTGGHRPLNVLPQGLALLPHWGVALTTSGPVRFLRGASPLPVPLRAKAQPAVLGRNPASTAGTLTYYGNGIAKSADGSTVAVIAGTSQASAHVFTFGLSGAAVCVNDTPAPIVDPGFGTEAGPFLALAPDGSRAAWKTTTTSGECFSRRVPSLPTPAEFQITGDLHFADTLNDTGVIAFFDPDSVVVVVGEANGAGGVEKGDLYRADFPALGAPSFTNLTNTSGDSTAPFLDKGKIETSDGIFQLPGKTGSVYFVPGSSGQGEVYRLNGATGAVQLLRSGIDQLQFIERAGQDLVLGLVHDQPFQREFLRVPADHAFPATSLAIVPGSQTFGPQAGDRTGRFAGILNVSGGQLLYQLFLPTGTGKVLTNPSQYGTVIGFDGRGGVLTTLRTTVQANFLSWIPTQLATYGPGPVESLVLPSN